MGQKTNPNIFRLGKTNDWKSKYIEKKTNEFYLYTAKDLEIRKFIEQFFKNHGLIIHTCRVNYSNNSLNIYVTYQQNTDSTFLLNEINKTHNVRLMKKKINIKNKYKKTYNNILKTIKNYKNYENLSYRENLEIKRFNISDKNKLKMKRIKMLHFYKNFLQLKTNTRINEIKNNDFISKLVESISIFLNKKVNITLILKPLQNNIKTNLDKKQHDLLKKKLVQLRKYKQNEFFKEGINLVFTCVNSEKSAKLLSKFIATNLKKLKRHNFFLKFIKNILTVFIVKTFSSTIKGIKIKVKGRFNGAPRAKHKIIRIGKNMPVLSLNSKIDYSETTAYTLNGTFGVKVWVCEK